MIRPISRCCTCFSSTCRSRHDRGVPQSTCVDRGLNAQWLKPRQLPHAPYFQHFYSPNTKGANLGHGLDVAPQQRRKGAMEMPDFRRARLMIPASSRHPCVACIKANMPYGPLHISDNPMNATPAGATMPQSTTRDFDTRVRKKSRRATHAVHSSGTSRDRLGV